ncbi:hypothetical protein F511_01709 [Dorcoceras hygrometricum]|nr:hypothetical protein F511_01709 [Dorcoceras hygrometricum]
MAPFDLRDVCMVIGSLATLDLPMVVDVIEIFLLKGPYFTLTMTNWFLQALSVISRGSWGDVARHFTMIRWEWDPDPPLCQQWFQSFGSDLSIPVLHQISDFKKKNISTAGPPRMPPHATARPSCTACATALRDSRRDMRRDARDCACSVRRSSRTCCARPVRTLQQGLHACRALVGRRCPRGPAPVRARRARCCATPTAPPAHAVHAGGRLRAHALCTGARAACSTRAGGGAPHLRRFRGGDATAVFEF